MKKIIFLFLFAIPILSALACAKAPMEGTAYEMVHKDYVGVSTVTVEKDSVKTVTFEEYYTPYTWAKVKSEEGEVPDDVITNSQGTWYGKYLVIGEKHFTASLREAPTIDGITYTNQTVKYSADDVDDLFAWLKASEANREWYVQQLNDQKAYVAKADWSKSDYETAGNKTQDGKLGFTKSATGYWPSSDTALGWSGNMAEIKEAIQGTKMDANDVDIKKGGDEDKYWEIDGIVTGATLVDFKDYYRLAQKAYEKALG